MPVSRLLKFIETMEDPSGPDCAGCSSFYYKVFECVVPGNDTFCYAVIPNSEVGGVGSFAEPERKRLDSSHFRRYSFPVSQ